MKKISVIALALVLPFVIFGQDSLLAFKEQYPFQLDEYKMKNIPFDDKTGFENRYYLRISSTNEFDVFPLADGVVSEIQHHPSFDSVIKVSIKHENNITSHYILSNIDNIKVGDFVVTKRRIGISLSRSFGPNDYYSDFAIQKGGFYILPELLNLLDFNCVDDIDDTLVKISEEIINKPYVPNIKTFLNISYKGNIYDLHVEKSSFENYFQKTLKNEESAFHKYEFEVFQDDRIKFIYLSDFVVGIQVENTDAIINESIKVGNSIEEVIAAFGNPNSIEIDDTSSLISNNILSISRKYNLVNYSINSFLYIVKDGIYDYYLKLYFSNDTVTAFAIFTPLP